MQDATTGAPAFVAMDTHVDVTAQWGPNIGKVVVRDSGYRLTITLEPAAARLLAAELLAAAEVGDPMALLTGAHR